MTSPSANTLNGGEALVQMLLFHEVNTIFGLCGDTSLPFYDALFRTGTSIRHILTRDERHAAYMADAYARVTGRVGVCEGPSGGGITYLLPGLAEANESSVSVLGLTTDIAIANRGRYTLTELDQEALLRPLTQWNQVIPEATSLPRAVRRAFITITTGRPGAAHLGLPFDVQKQPLSPEAIWANPEHGTFPAHRMGVDPWAVERASKILHEAKRPIVICGGGVVISQAQAPLRRIAEHLGIPIATTISGQGSISEYHPLSLGVVGSNGGTLETREFVVQSDLVVFVGCRAGSVTTERWQYPAPGIRVIHIDCDPEVIGINYPVDVAILGDALLSLTALAEAVEEDSPPRDRSEVERAVSTAQAAKFAHFHTLAQSSERPIKPERVVHILQSVLPPEAMIIADPGTPCPYFSAYYRFPSGRHFISNRAHGALGYALPAAIGAAIGRPGVPCVGVMGDGSFGMAVGELETAVRLQLPIIYIVFNNATFGWIKAGQKSGFAERYYAVDFNRTDHAAVAAGFGLKTWRVEKPEELIGALSAAMQIPGPTLIDILTEPLHEAAAPVSEWIA